MPAIQALREVLGNHENLIAVVNKMRSGLFVNAPKNLVPNVALLQSYGISIESIRNHIVRVPNVYAQSRKSFEDSLIRVEERLGIRRDSAMFLYGVDLLGGLSEESIDSKCQVFKSFGWTELEIQELIKRSPYCLKFSEARIEKSLEFLMNELGYKPGFIVLSSALLTYSLEKQIIPRQSVTGFEGEMLDEEGLLSLYPCRLE